MYILAAPAKSPYQGYSREQLQNALVEKVIMPELTCGNSRVFSVVYSIA